MKSLFKKKKRATQQVVAKNVVKEDDDYGDDNHESDVRCSMHGLFVSRKTQTCSMLELQASLV